MQNKYKKGVLQIGGTKVTKQTMVVGVEAKKGFNIGSEVLAFLDGSVYPFEHTGVYHILIEGNILIVQLKKGFIKAMNR
tara:strand:- start:200 stop:436 length:237 start_codon:yes stop_codon:yes gene_type:complete